MRLRRVPGELIAARAVLGLGAAVIFPMSIAVLPVLFAPDEQPRAIAVVMGATFIAFPVGPLLGGWLLDNFWWGSVFLINVPVVALALVAVALLMPESHGARSSRIDIPGIVLSSLGLAGLTYGCIKAGENGWGNPAALATILAGAAVLAVFVAWERRASRHGMALVQLELFRSAAFTWGTILTTFVSFAMFGILFAMPQYFQGVRGLDSFATGLRMLPMIGGMVIGMIGGTRLQTPPKGPDGRPAGDAPVGPKILVMSGFVVMAAGLAVGATTSAASGTGVHRDLVRGRGAGPGAGHAGRHERGAGRAVRRAERIRVGADHRACARSGPRSGSRCWAPSCCPPTAASSTWAASRPPPPGRCGPGSSPG